MPEMVLAADLGATRMRAAAVTTDGTVTARAERRTPDGPDPGAVIETLIELLREVHGKAPRALAVCAAAAGLVAGDEGRVVVAPNIPGFRDVPLAAALSDSLGLPAFVENDASAAALGEYRFGAARGVRHLLHATLGTGIGGGIVIDGRLYRGAKGFAGEIGHIIVDPSGPRCGCGARGCLEALASGVAFADRARRLVESGKAPILAEMTAGRDPTGEDLLAAARAGDLAAEAEIRNGGHLLGLGLASLLNVLNPDMLTLSGGLLAMGDLLLEPMRRVMRALPYGPAAGTAIRLTELGDDTGLLGAAAVAFERLER
jgi:glucokinase